jgi:uncharacterized protein DUF6452
MKKISILIILTFIFISITLSCEKDDICAETTPTTPKLILRFYDITSQEDTKNATGLRVTEFNETNAISNLNVVTTDSINMPLRTDVNVTKFTFHKDYKVITNTEGDTISIEGNPDIVTINYQREDVYVSRACGFKTIFNNITLSVEDDGDKWVLNSEIINSTVENEITAHVKILH